jgi:hypothetical protein
VRRLAAALSPASLLAVSHLPSNSGQQAGLKQSGSKLPHSKKAERRYHLKPTVFIIKASHWLAKFS